MRKLWLTGALHSRIHDFLLTLFRTLHARYAMVISLTYVLQQCLLQGMLRPKLSLPKVAALLCNE